MIHSMQVLECNTNLLKMRNGVIIMAKTLMSRC